MSKTLTMFDHDRNLVEKYGINDKHEPSHDDRIAFVEEQIEQIKKMAWRVRVDMMVLNNASVDSESEADERTTKIKNFQKELGKYVEALNSFDAILKEL